MPASLARFRGLAVGLRWMGLLALCAPVVLPAAPPHSFPSRTSSRVTVNGLTYTNADTFFARYGLKGRWLKADTSRLYYSDWTRIEIDHDEREITYNGTRIFLGESAVVRGHTLYIPEIDADRLLGPLLRPVGIPVPRPLRTIVIDAGHGGKDTGTRNTALHLDEKTFTLAVAKRLAELLSGGGWRVVMTRTTDHFVELGDRAAKARAVGADLFVSIHFNAVAGAPGVKGSETYVLTPRYERSTSSSRHRASDNEDQPGNAYDAWSSVLGYDIHRSLLDKLHSEDRGLKRARFAVLRLAPCPAVLVEAGYLSNPTEARKIASGSYQSDIAEAIANGIKAYAASYATAGK